MIIHLDLTLRRGLCDREWVHILPHGNNGANAAAIRAIVTVTIPGFWIDGARGTKQRLPACGMKHVTAPQPAHSLACMEWFGADGTCPELIVEDWENVVSAGVSCSMSFGGIPFRHRCACAVHWRIDGQIQVIEASVSSHGTKVCTVLVRDVAGCYGLVREPGSLLHQSSSDDVLRIALGLELSDVETHFEKRRQVGIPW